MEEDNFGRWKEPLYEDAESSSEHSVLMGREEQYTKMTPRRRWLWWSSLRLLLEVLMGLFIIVTVSLLGSHQIIWYPPKSTILRYGPSLPEKSVTFGNIAGFGPELVYVDHEMLKNATHKKELHENWQKLYPKGRGYIAMREGDEFEAFNPAFAIDDVVTKGDHHEGWILSVFHQLHCLSILMQRLGTSYEEFGLFTRQELEHTSHCVEYLRQSILCAADTSMEGETGAWPDSTAWGQRHTCKDYNALMEMANERSIWDLSNARHPNLTDVHLKHDEHDSTYGGP
ncbi:hypothetical protein F5882DRAFT_523755 [Hyaloscypha sp. PMI_1271]|nr:hypothetical protein F5882DRAFT_523755 [Hyaloscypha sp. PMI_1271]